MMVLKLRPFFLRQIRMVLLLLLLLHATLSMPEEEKTENDDFDDELYSIIHSVRDGSLWSKSRHTRSINVNQTTESQYVSDNSLWNDLWFECKSKPSFTCVRTGVFRYLDKSLEKSEDFSLTDSLYFRKNKNKFNGVCENSEDEKNSCLRYNEEKSKVKEKDIAEEENEIKISENEIDKSEELNSIEDETTASNSTREEKKESEEEDVTEGLADGRSVPSLNEVSDMLYDKGTNFLMTHDMEFQLPKLFFGGGTVKIEPKHFVEGDENEEEGTMVKIVFKPPPPSDQVIRGRLFGKLKKLFKKKLMHSFMALMLILKMIKVKLMFLVPMIVGKATAKKLLLKVLLFLIPGLAHLFKLCHYYHMEHTKYHHHHHKIKHHHHHIKVPVPVPVPVHVDPNIPHYDPYGKPSGPSGGGYDYPPYPPSHNSGYDSDYDYPGSSHYGSVSNYFDNEAHLSSWGLGSSNIHEAGVLDAKNQPLYYKNHPYGGYYGGGEPVAAYSQQQQQYVNNAHLLTPKPPPNGPVATYDAFYSPILQKIDNVFGQMGFNDEPCRERLVCSMYKTPHRFSPHSNLLSNELSRDAKDLQKPVVSNAAVLRFYRYIQAARDGQDQKDCLRLYPSCPVNTEPL